MPKPTGPLFKWFGSKWLASKKMPAPIHADIVEPFAGGAGYALRHAERSVTIAETDPHLRMLWPWLIGATEQSIRDIPLDVPVGTDIRTLGLSHGQALLLKSWQRTNNVGDCWTISPWGSKPGQWTASTRARVAEEVQAIRHWKFLVDARELLASGMPATWFIDPPYQYNYQYRQKGVDYEALARTVLGLHGQVIVCEARHHETDQAPTWLPFQDAGSYVTSRRRSTNHHHSRELLYYRTSLGPEPIDGD